MSQRMDVFISSTARDLPIHRKEAMDACLRMGMFPIMMEHLPARDADAIEASLQMVDEAEIYVGIFAWRYGYVPNGHAISITEMEYQRAVERGIPRLIFIMHDDHELKMSDVEKGTGAVRLEALKARLQTEQVVNFFKSADDLRGQVIHSLVPYRVADLGNVQARHHIPLPPESYVAHPYTLLQTGQVIGRKKELSMLNDWAAQPEGAAFQFVVAMGGMGKSALTWKWFNECAPQVMKPLAGRMWWSFYEHEATFENFVIRALAYVSGRAKDEIEALPAAEREMELYSSLDREPFLLVLDGFERAMMAYARMDAARLSDDDLDEITAAHTNRVQLRKMTDPRLREFLRKLARVRSSRILVSTRLYPAELQTDTGEPLPGCAACYLRGLEDDDALRLWAALGVSGSRDNVLALFHTFDNHPLIIRALAGEVAQYRRAPGQFDQWYQAHPHFKPFELPIVQVKNHILTFALQGLSEQGRQVLSTIAAFRMPATYDTLAALLVGEKRLLANEHELDGVLSELEDRGLVGWDRRANRYDLHPVVRGVTWDTLGGSTKTTVYQGIADYFAGIPVPEGEAATSVDDLAPAIELYNALIGLGRYDDAFHIFYNRLSRPMQYRWSANRQKAELLTMLFPDGIEQLPRLKKVSSQAFVLGHLARSYNLTGNPAQAVPLYERNLVAREKSTKSGILKAVVLGQLSDVRRVSGQLYKSELSARRAYSTALEIKDALWEGDSLKWLSSILASRGEVDQAAAALKRATAIFEAQAHKPLLCATYARAAQLKLWQKQYEEAQESADITWELSMQVHNEHDVIRALRLRGEAALGLGDVDAAGECLHEALLRARATNLIEEELPLLVGLAKLAQRQGDDEQARAHLGNGWELAERGPYPLFHADALNVLAQIEGAEAAQNAYEKAWCDGPPYAYHWGLAEAKQRLDALGLPYPILPAFEASQYEPMPEIDL